MLLRKQQAVEQTLLLQAKTKNKNTSCRPSWCILWRPRPCGQVRDECLNARFHSEVGLYSFSLFLDEHDERKRKLCPYAYKCFSTARYITYVQFRAIPPKGKHFAICRKKHTQHKITWRKQQEGWWFIWSRWPHQRAHIKLLSASPAWCLTSYFWNCCLSTYFCFLILQLYCSSWDNYCLFIFIITAFFLEKQKNKQTTTVIFSTH